MLIAKVIDVDGRETFAEVLKTGRVQFDGRDGWVLLSSPLDVRANRRELRWMHPADTVFVWVRLFRFQSVAPATSVLTT